MPTIGQGLMIGGSALAQGMSERYARKAQVQKDNELARLLGVKPEQLPGYTQNMELLNALIPQAPLQTPSPMDPAKDPMAGVTYSGARGQVQGQYDQAATQQNELMKALIMSGDPKARDMAMAMSPKIQAMMPKEPEKPVVVGKNVWDPATKSFITPPQESSYTIEQFDDGTLRSFDKTTGKMKIVDRVDPKAELEFDTYVDPERSKGMGREVKLVKYRDKNSSSPNWTYTDEIADYSSPDTQRVVQTNLEGAEGSMSDDAVWKRKALTDVQVAKGAARRVGRIQDTFKPFYQSYAGKIAKFGLSLTDKFLPDGLPDGQAKELLADMSQFEQNTNENMNLYIKEITGAQMSEAEAGRLSKAVANLGDSQTEFKSKLDNTQRVLDQAASVLEQEMAFYGNMKNPMDYKEALEYAQKKASVYISDELDKYDVSGKKKAKEGSEEGPGFDPPVGFKWRQEPDGSFTPVPAG